MRNKAYFTPVNNANLGVVPASDINPWYNKPRYLEDSVEVSPVCFDSVVAIQA